MKSLLNPAWILVAFATSLTLGCSHGKKVDLSDSPVAKKDGVLAISASSLKDKGKKYDINVTIENQSKGYMIIMLNDISCGRGETTGVLKHTFFNTGERTIDLGPGQEKSFSLVCSKVPNSGSYFISVRHVYDNPSDDRATPGKVIASDVKWSHGA